MLLFSVCTEKVKSKLFCSFFSPGRKSKDHPAKAFGTQKTFSRKGPFFICINFPRHGENNKNTYSVPRHAEIRRERKCEVNEEKKSSQNEEKENSADTVEVIEKTGGIVSSGNGECIQCLTVIGQIEGHYLLSDGQKATKYEHIIPMLVSAEESEDIDGVLLLLNTMGGDVEAGLAIAEMVSGMSKPTVSLVLGGGHSIGVPLAVSADTSFIVPSATMTIHPVRMSGTVVGVPQTYYYFQRMQDRIVDFIVRNSSVTEEKFRDMLMRTDQIATDVGTLIDGGEAVSCGLIDRLGGLSDALGELRRMIRERKPTHDGFDFVNDGKNTSDEGFGFVDDGNHE